MSIRQLVNDNSINKNKLVHTKHGWMTYSSLALAGIALPMIGMIQKANADTVSSVSDATTSQVSSQSSSTNNTSSQDDKQIDSLANDNSVKINAEYASINNENVSAKTTVDNKANDSSQPKSVTPQVTQSKAEDVTAKKATSNNNGVSPEKVEVKAPAVQSTAKSLAQNSSEDVAPAKSNEVDKVATNSLSSSSEKSVVNTQNSSSVKQDAPKSTASSDDKSLSTDVAAPSVKSNDIDESAKTAKLNLSSANFAAINNTNDAIAAAAAEKHNYSFASFAATPIKVTINYQENGKTIKTASLTTNTGSFDPNTDVPSGYEIKSGWSMGETPVSNGQITVNVPVEKKQTPSSNITPGTTNNITGNDVKPGTVNPTPVDNIVVTINYQDESGKTIKTASQTVKNGASVNVQTDCPSGYNVKSGWSVSNMPVKDGKATLNVPVVKASTAVDGSSATTTTPSSIKATINYVFNGQTVATQTVTVPNGANIDVSKGVPSGYQIQSGWQSGEIKSSDGTATITVPLVKAQSSSNDGMVAVTINYKDGSNVVKSVVQNVKSGASVDLNAGMPQGYEITPGFKPQSIDNITDGKATMDVPVQKVQSTSSSSTSSSSSSTTTKPSTGNNSSSTTKPSDNTTSTTTKPSTGSSSSSTTTTKPSGTATSPSDSGSTTDKPTNTTKPSTSDDGTGSVGDSGSTADKVTKPAGTGSTTTNGTNKPSEGTQQASGTPADVAKPSDNNSSSSTSTSKPSISGSTSITDDKTSSSADNKNDNQGSTTKHDSVAPDDGNGTTGDNGSNKAQVITPAGTGSVVTGGTNAPSIGTQTAGSDHPSATNPDAVNNTNTSSTSSEPQGVNSDDSKTPGSLNSNNADVSKINGSETDESKASEQPSLTVPKDKNDATNADIYPGEGIIPGSNGQQVSSLNGMTPYKDDTKDNSNSSSQIGSADKATSKEDSKSSQTNVGTTKANNGVANDQLVNAQSVSKEQSVASPSMISEANTASQIGSVAKQSSQIGSASSSDELPQTGDKESALVELGLLAASMIGLSAMGIEKKHE